MSAITAPAGSWITAKSPYEPIEARARIPVLAFANEQPIRPIVSITSINRTNAPLSVDYVSELSENAVNDTFIQNAKFSSEKALRSFCRGHPPFGAQFQQLGQHALDSDRE